MIISEERANAIAEYFGADEERTVRLMGMEAEDAAKAMTADGCEVTAEELADIAKLFSSTAEGELSEDALEDVAGGCWNCVYKIIRQINRPIMPVYRWLI